MGRADLHAHTTASDGTYSPRELVRAARERGLAAVGVCDHDTTLGVPEALAEGEKQGVIVVPGVELSCEERAFEVHILGYFVDINSPALQSTLRNLRRQRVSRIRRILAKLERLGIRIGFDEVMKKAEHGAVGRPHVAAVLHERGYGESQRDSFRKYLSKGGPAYVPRRRLSPEEAVTLIRTAGGVPVFAHPGIVGLDELIEQLAARGLRGVEVWHSDHTPEMAEKYQALADRLGLLATGGSDSHGPGSSRAYELGSVTVPVEVVDALREEAARIRRASAREVG